MKSSLVLLCFVAFFVSVRGATAADETRPRPPETFEIEGNTAFVFAAPLPAAGKPWLWYAPTLKGVSLTQRPFYFDRLMRAGIAVAGFDLGEVRGSPASTARFAQFHAEMVRRGWNAQPILLGQSRGGLMMLAWAVRHPEKVRAFAGIYPVFNLANWPMKAMPVTLADYGLTESEFRAQLNELNPIEHLDGLAARKVPFFVVHGDTDIVVPYEANTGLLKERYEARGGPIAVKVIAGEGHKVSPAFFECQELIDFVLRHGAP